MAGTSDLEADGVKKADLAALIKLVQPFETRANGRTGKRHNTLRGEDWTLCTENTEPNEQDSPFVQATKKHILYELGILQVLRTVEKCKDVVSYFKRSGLNSTLVSTLKQEVETRWNSILLTLESFFTHDNQLVEVNDILRQHGQGDLVLSADDETTMKGIISVLSPFKTESLKLEGKGPTIQFVFLSFLRLKDVCAPKETDCDLLRKLRSSLSQQLSNKYASPHMRHLLGMFFWPKFRKLLRLSPIDRAEVVAEARRLCAEVKEAQMVMAPDLRESLAEPSHKKCHTDYDEYADEDPEEMDEVDLYLAELPTDTQVDSHDIVTWWQERTKRYPSLSIVARMILATPATSAASERTFSVGGHVVNGRRNNLHPDTLDDTLFLHQYLKQK